MKALRTSFQSFGLSLFLIQEPMEPTPQEVLAELRSFLKQRRAYTDSWFFLLRVMVGLGLFGYLGGGALVAGEIEPSQSMLLVMAYVLSNVFVHILSNRGFEYARWGYLSLDFLAVLILRHQVRFDALLDPNATMIGLFSLLLIAYVQYSDIRLSSVLAVATLVFTVLTFWIDLFSLLPVALPLTATMAPRNPEPLQAVLLLSYVAGVSVMTHRLVHRLYAQLLRYSMEEHKRTKAAVSSAVERSRRERLEELNQLKHNFITVISHELRTPITPLLTSLDILRQELLGKAGDFEMLDIARDSAERIQRVVTDYTKLAELITMDDDSLLRWNLRLSEMLTYVQDHAKKKTRLLGSFEDLVVCADARLLGGALLALMRRAEMLTPDDGTITLRGYDDREEVVLSIHDPASFIEGSTIESLDDVFAMSSERAFASPNTGLELILARHSLRRLGGMLQIESHPQHGTTVHVSIPGQQPGLRWIKESQLRQELVLLGL